jgi:hypothetical protein
MSPRGAEGAVLVQALRAESGSPEGVESPDFDF